MTLQELQDKLQELYALGATGYETVFLEGAVVTGVEGLKISTRTIAKNAGLCRPHNIKNHLQIVNIWGTPD